MSAYELVIRIDAFTEGQAQRCAEALLEQARKVKPWVHVEAVRDVTARLADDDVQMTRTDGKPTPRRHRCPTCSTERGYVWGDAITEHVDAGQRSTDLADLVQCTGCGRLRVA